MSACPSRHGSEHLGRLVMGPLAVSPPRSTCTEWDWLGCLWLQPVKPERPWFMAFVGRIALGQQVETCPQFLW